jgi:hypothetical protein
MAIPQYSTGPHEYDDDDDDDDAPESAATSVCCSSRRDLGMHFSVFGSQFVDLQHALLELLAHDGQIHSS